MTPFCISSNSIRLFTISPITYLPCENRVMVKRQEKKTAFLRSLREFKRKQVEIYLLSARQQAMREIMASSGVI